MKPLIVALSLLLAGCATVGEYIPTGAAAVGAGIGAAVGGPGGAVIGAATAGASVKASLPSAQPLSTDPEIARQQIQAQEHKALLGLIERWGIYAMILFALIFWILPDPMKLVDRVRRKSDG